MPDASFSISDAATQVKDAIKADSASIWRPHWPLLALGTVYAAMTFAAGVLLQQGAHQIGVHADGATMFTQRHCCYSTDINVWRHCRGEREDATTPRQSAAARGGRKSLLHLRSPRPCVSNLAVQFCQLFMMCHASLPKLTAKEELLGGTPPFRHSAMPANLLMNRSDNRH